MMIRILGTAVFAALAWAQETHDNVVLEPPRTVAYMAQGASNVSSGADFHYMSIEVAGKAEVVKGAPFSAETVTEFTQQLADGNKIRRQQTGGFYRDSDGRTRREQEIGIAGPFPPPAKAPRMVFIDDPVAGISYVLNPEQKTAQKLPMRKGPSGDFMALPPMMGGFAVKHGSGQGVSVIRAEKRAAEAEAQTDTETKVIEGIQATGRRISHTIPAGEVGNDRPIETSSESWYSPELQTVILSKSSDPRMGDTTYRLTNINRTEPSPELFQVPADYTVTDVPSGPVQIRMREHGPQKEPK